MAALKACRPHEVLAEPAQPRDCDLTAHPKPVYRGERTCDADCPFAVRALCGRPRSTSTRLERWEIIAARRLLNPLLGLLIGLAAMGAWELLRQVIGGI
ncbi:MAG: hypothetical protein H6873_05705 [Hyphomicrobiaceae bacterium]|nr:hypothetical protein [Hyphomicrobiaceae bacterium]